MKIKEEISDSFSVQKGIRQGGILSPYLFNVHTADLFNELEHTQVGCYIGEKFCGELGFTDDTNIIFNLKSAMVKAVVVCFEYFKKKGLSINLDECHLIHKKKNGHVRDIILGDPKRYSRLTNYQTVAFCFYCLNI